MKLVTGTGWSALAKLTLQVLQGEIDVVFQQYVEPSSRCEQIAARFDVSPAKRSRNDNVPGAVLGVSHYGSDPATYMEACQHSASAVNALFEGFENPIRRLYTALELELGRPVRPAVFFGNQALPCRAGAWAAHAHEQHEWAVRHHEDLAQVRAWINADWEISGVPRVVAINMYARVSPGTGQLVVWDFRPDESFRASYGVDQSGYPYPADSVASRPFVELPVRAGDFVIIDGAQMHAVRASSGDRLVINAFLGVLTDGTLAYWT